MKATQQTMTPNQIRRVGLAALRQALGPVGALRFLHQFSPGEGDYTAERAEIIGTPTLDDLMAKLKKAEPQLEAERRRAQARVCNSRKP